MRLHINKTRTKTCKNHTYLEAKQYATKQTMGHGKHQRENKKYPKTNENGNTMFKNLWVVTTAVLRGKFIVLQSTSGNKKNLK